MRPDAVPPGMGEHGLDSQDPEVPSVDPGNDPCRCVKLGLAEAIDRG